MSNPIELAESYRVLEIKPGATVEEVAHAHKTLAETWDVSRFNTNDPRRRKAERKLRQINRAYEVLMAELGEEGDAAEALEAEDATAEAAPAPAPAPTGPPRHWSTHWRYLWIFAMVLALAYLAKDSNDRMRTIQRTSEISMTNFPLPEHDPKSPTGYPGNQHNLVLPALGTDGQHWTMQTERMLDGREGWRVRHVDYDGVAPVEQISGNTVRLDSSQAELLQSSGSASQLNNRNSTTEPTADVTGRDIHWSSSLHWLAAGLAWVEHLVTGKPITYTLENTVQWANTFALAMVMFLLPIAVVRRLGSIATALLAVCFIAVYPYYEFSFVGYYDHHGLVASCNLMIVLFTAMAGAGWLRNEELNPDNLSPVDKVLWQWLPTRRHAKGWMIASGFFVGAGLWISTASVIPALAGVGVAALISTGFFARTTTRCANPALKKVTPWIIWFFTGLGFLGAWVVMGFLPATLGLIAGGIATAGMISGSLLPWLAALFIALSAYFVDGGGHFWATGHWAGVWGGILGAGLGGSIAFGLTKTAEEKNSMGRADPTLWRVWGCAAGLASLFFYLLEYAPTHFTMRLEVNHPFYALALFGAGEIMCRLSWLISGQEQPQGGFWRRQWRWMAIDGAIFLGTPFALLLFSRFKDKFSGVLVPLFAALVIWVAVVAAYWVVRYFSLLNFDQPVDKDEAHWRKNWLWMMLCLAAVALLPSTIFVFGEKVFVIRPGQFLLNLHADYILEFRSFLRQMGTLTPVQIVAGISMIPLSAIPIGLLLFSAELQRIWKVVLLSAVLPAMVMLVLAIFQIRWLGISCAMWCAALAVATLVTTSPGSAFRWREGFRKPLAVLLLTVIFVPYPLTTTIGWMTNRDSVGELDLQQIVTRDLSERLRLRIGNETGVVLSGPTTTTWMMYFGGFHGIGSLYWENVAGLKTAAEIYGAKSWEEAKSLIDKYHITHIAIYSWDPFAMEYARLGHTPSLRLPQSLQEEYMQYFELKDAFIVKLWIRHLPFLPDSPDYQPLPPWLRFVPYQVPNSPLLKGNTVMLLEVVPPQKPLDADLRVAQYLMTKSEPEALENAGKILGRIFKVQPGYYPALITRTILDQVRGDAAAYQADVQEVIANIAKANELDFPFEDRVNLAQLLITSDNKPAAFAQVQKCFATATESDLRRLPTDRLVALLQWQVHLPAELAAPQKAVELAMSLLPKPLQGQILTERAVALSATDPAQSIKLFHEALKLTPDFEPAMATLAKLLVLTPDIKLHNGMEALELINKAATLGTRTQSIESLQVMACASAELGKFEDAIFYSHMALMFIDDSIIKGAANEAIMQKASEDWTVQIKRFENHQTLQLPPMP